MLVFPFARFLQITDLIPLGLIDVNSLAQSVVCTSCGSLRRYGQSPSKSTTSTLWGSERYSLPSGGTRDLREGCRYYCECLGFISALVTNDVVKRMVLQMQP